ncbi:MAG TPA: hypothetical protein PKY82_02615 [Pyrinomonadaceae bacterium]|nr:hypothetical protein [Pyrinomonadaceae bacterium]
MTGILRVRESFSHSEYDSLQECCRILCEELQEVCEFFYTLEISNPERYFFIRTNAGKREKFIECVKRFSETMNFEILNGADAKIISRKYDLDTFI